MENNNNFNDVVIEKSWTLKTFVEANGNPKYREDTNKETGEVFNSLCFDEAPQGRIFCHFGASTKDMSMADIARNKETLRIGLNSNGKYTCYKPDDKGTLLELW